MPRHFLRKLELYTHLSAADREALESAVGEKRRRVGPREDIVREGDHTGHVNLVLEGWACRYKQLEDGRRQIVALFVPGDLCDTHIDVLREMDHAIGTLTPATYAEVSRDTLGAIAARHPRIMQALWWDTLVSASIQREWTVNLGQRSASERLGHLLCELFLRLRGVGLTEGNHCVLPTTQADLADAMGLSTVHINRTLQDLRRAGLIVLKGRNLTIPDLAALQAASLFTPNYLHFDHIGRHLDAVEPVAV
ncbi:Crp/Fnr family transcriptional regulator [Methylobacterium radiodurans]|uniref:Cyclic nucleotide-binding protein n=1 Tax=Methylobacterium radiodurans TaxID=2202828 RepID=A0A2U8VLE8_9HYPH|nr:Crp/Fnr family transcriptional regulator [Methylobacterium radiodurans]AWN34475.1 cyclic nucleotide-binding protein [Methylobacterium radiodurans]